VPPVPDTIVNQVHWWFKKRESARLVADDLFLGGKFVTGNDEYLWKHQAEDSAAYALRKKMANYENRFARILQVKTDTIFRAKIVRAAKTDSDDEQFLKDVDGRGTPIDDYMKCWYQWAEVEDVAYTLIDRPTAPIPVSPNEAEAIQTAAQARTANLFPRFVFIRALDLMDWATDALGNIVAIKFRQMVADESPIDQPRTSEKTKHEYFIWTVDGWWRFDSEGKQVASRPLNLRAVPLVALYSKQLGAMISVSRNDDAVGLARKLYNLESQNDSEIHFNGFSTVVLPSRVRPSDNAESAESEFIRGIGHYCGVDPDSKNQPFLLETTGKPYEIMSDRADKFIDKMCDAMAVRRVNVQSAAGEGASGEAKKWDFMATNDDTVGNAKRCEAAENRAHYFRALWDADGNAATAEEAAFKAEYPTDFNLKTGDEMLAEIERETLAITASPTFLLAHQRIYINSHPDKKFFTPEENESIDLELEARELAADVSPPVPGPAPVEETPNKVAA